MGRARIDKVKTKRRNLQEISVVRVHNGLIVSRSKAELNPAIAIAPREHVGESRAA
ncbi:hypothetical protein BDZ89DRAFT_1072667 [Hymenopellis radicata]|nr:hypothetical protein BDZ89DRAFT_1072667 [Hymenopellis radicata]